MFTCLFIHFLFLFFSFFWGGREGGREGGRVLEISKNANNATLILRLNSLFSSMEQEDTPLWGEIEHPYD